MNAAIALCHFCEAHGPCAVFCTQTLRDTKIEDVNFDHQQIPNKLCSACNSLGQSNAIFSKDNESGATFLSTQIPVLPELYSLIKQASVRSLSCEISSNKEGGFVFFGDASRGHVLSHTFHVKDMQHRGFYQLFSIIILMKDKLFLLNIKPFLAEHLKRISTEIQTSASKIYDTEYAKGSPRQRRVSDAQVLVQLSRSLVELTGEPNIFAVIHSHFSWLLLAGSRFLTEHVTFGNLPWLPTNSGLSREYITLPFKQFDENLDDDQEEFYSLRHVKSILKKDFNSLCYCAIVGIKIIVRGTASKTYNFMVCLKKLLPENMQHLVHIDSPHFLTNSECKIVSVPPEIAVPIQSNSIFRIDFIDDDYNTATVKWPGGLLPNKWPDLLTKIVKAVEQPQFTDLVLNKHTKVLIEEWKNKVICISRAKSTSSVNKLRKVLGIQEQDDILINYWSSHFKN